MRILYKGVVCETGYYRIMGKDIPSLYYIDSHSQETMLKAGFDEVHYGLWVKILNDEEFQEVLRLIEEKYM